MFEFRSVLQSMFTLQRIILGTENFDEMWDTNRVLGPLFFSLWVLVGYFVLSNMFVAILVESISNDKVRAIPHIGVADSARSAYSRWQIWQARTEETKKEEAAKVSPGPHTIQNDECSKLIGRHVWKDPLVWTVFPVGRY